MLINKYNYDLGTESVCSMRLFDAIYHVAATVNHDIHAGM